MALRTRACAATSRRLARSSSAPILLTLPLTRPCPCGPPTTTRITVTADAFLSCLPCCPPPLPAAVSGASCPSCLPASLHGLSDCALLLTHIALLLSRHLCRFSQHCCFTLHALCIAQCKCELLHVCTRNSKGMLEEAHKASMRLFVSSAPFSFVFAVLVRNVLSYCWHGWNEILARLPPRTVPCYLSVCFSWGSWCSHGLPLWW